MTNERLVGKYIFVNSLVAKIQLSCFWMFESFSLPDAKQNSHSPEGKRLLNKLQIIELVPLPIHLNSPDIGFRITITAINQLAAIG